MIVVEVMGRDSGWIAMYSGLAGGADVILIPERPFDIEEVAEALKLRHYAGSIFPSWSWPKAPSSPNSLRVTDPPLIVQDLGRDEFGHVRLGGIGNILAKEIERRTGFETRAVVLGHVQRGGSPSAFDRVLAHALWQRSH